MLTPLLAKIPGTVFLRALLDGEPAAFVMLLGVIVVFGFWLMFFHMKVDATKSKS